MLLLNPGPQGLEYKAAGFFIAMMIEAASYKMILQVLCIQLLYQKKFYVCKLIYLETEVMKETSENRAAIKEVCTMPSHYYILKTD
jgi:hypothetical protein